jgi:VIT1/CCC1 family predicted Fe2+/Mn2+ transporter
MIVSALTLFVIGSFKAYFTIGNRFKSGLQMVVIGIVSALAGYGIGLLFTAK